LGDVHFFQEEIKKDPLLVTPIGICLNFYDQKNNFIFVNFNGERIKLYNNNRLSIVDAAIQAGFPNEALFPRRGKALNFKVNGKTRMIRGELGEAAIVTLNGNYAGINSQIESNDKIKITGSTFGEDAKLSIDKIPEFSHTIDIYAQGKKIVCPQYAEVNGQIVSNYYEIQDGDDIIMRNYYTVAQILEFMDINLGDDAEILVNNKPVDLDEKVYENFSINWIINDYAEDFDDDLEETFEMDESEKNINSLSSNHSEKAEEKTDELKQVESKEPVNLELTVNNKMIILKGKSKYVFVDIFDWIDFDLKNSKGRDIITKLNGENARFTQELNTADVVEIYWKE